MSAAAASGSASAPPTGRCGAHHGRDPSWSIDYHVALSGYGEWVWVDGLGQCWMPWVTPQWRPFTYGRWVWTSFGWTWVAYEPWGYFPHHFGNWTMAPVGWVWVPGTSYHAANVVWISNDEWIGWYPRPPHGWQHHHHHGDNDGWREGWDDARHATFVGWNDLASDDLSQRAIGADAVRARAPGAVLREDAPAPTRHELGRRGVTVPEMSLERRTARIAGREVVLARPREAVATVERNAGRTVGRALAPQAVDTITRRATAGRAVAAARPLPRAAATTAPRPGAAATPSSTVTSGSTGSDRAAERPAGAPSSEKSRARSDERPRRGEAQPADERATVRPSSHRRQ